MEPPTKISRTLCTTEDLVIQNHIVWTIDNFSLHLGKVGKCLISAPFTTGHANQFRWQLKLYPNGRKGCEGFVSVFIRPLSLLKGEMRTKFSVAVLDSNREEVHKKKGGQTFHPGSYWGWSKWITKECLLDKDFLGEDRLSLSCDLVVVESSFTASRQISTSEVPGGNLPDDFGALLENQAFSDVSLRASEGRELRAHRNILAARSPVFSAMFSHDMEEKEQGRVDIVDMGFEELKEMVRFIYTGKAPNLDKLASQLLPAADKYALERLKWLCQQALIRKLKVANAAELLIIGDTHVANQLKAQALFFICSHSSAVMATEGWKVLLQHPHLVRQVCRALGTQDWPLPCLHYSSSLHFQQQNLLVELDFETSGT